MDDPLYKFENIVRKSYEFTEERSAPTGGSHPFDERNIHDQLIDIARKLFDDGHFAQASFEAFKFVDKKIQHHAKSSESGFKLMMQVFSGNPAVVRLTAQKTKSEQDEQDGYKFLFAGSMSAIRNPRAHEVAVKDSPDTCLDHLSFASLLLRRLEESGYI